MGIIIKQSISSSIITYIGILIGTFNTLWLFPNFLLPEQIGLLRLMLDIPSLFAYFVQLGAPNLSDRFFHYFKNPERQHNGFLFLILFYPLISFTLFGIAYYLFGDYWLSIFDEKSYLLVQYSEFILPTTFLMMYIFILESYLRANMNIILPSFFREVLIRLFFTLSILLYHFEVIDIQVVLYIYVFAYIISLIGLLWHIKSLGILFIKPSYHFISPAVKKEMGIYILYLIPGTAGVMIVQKLDSLMIGSMEGLKNVAVYSLAFFIGTVVEVPRKTITQITIPILSNACKEMNIQVINELYKKNSLIQFMVGVVIFSIIWINVDDILSIIPQSQVYREGKYVILFIGLGKLLDMSTSINAEIIQYSKYYRVNTFSIFFIVIASIVLNMVLIPIYNINGAALSILITVGLANIFRTAFLYKKMGIQPFSFPMIYILFLGICWFILSTTFKFNHTNKIMILSGIITKSFILLLSFIVLIRVFRISEELNQIMDRILLKIKIL